MTSPSNVSADIDEASQRRESDGFADLGERLVIWSASSCRPCPSLGRPVISVGKASVLVAAVYPGLAGAQSLIDKAPRQGRRLH
jgi:hypothetical protein